MVPAPRLTHEPKARCGKRKYLPKKKSPCSNKHTKPSVDFRTQQNNVLTNTQNNLAAGKNTLEVLFHHGGTDPFVFRLRVDEKGATIVFGYKAKNCVMRLQNRWAQGRTTASGSWCAVHAIYDEASAPAQHFTAYVEPCSPRHSF